MSQDSKAIYRPLVGAIKGQVVTRFPPEPSGYLHLGHAKALLLNHKYARDNNGKLILRFDDTNPTKENENYVNAIKEDIQTLGIDYDKLTYTSDYFDILEQYAEKLIKDGYAYVDSSTQDEMKKQRELKIDSPFRNNTTEQNLTLWAQMKSGQNYVLRAKINMKSTNGCMRDPTLYRIILSPHHRTGDKYKIYPTYDFACPIVDSIEGVTHALRSNEYHDRNEQYNWVLKTTEITPVKVADYSRLNFAYTILSKRKLQWFIDNKIVEDWDNPAFPTIRGSIRRGLTIEALKRFIYAQGSSMRETCQDMGKLWSINKQIIDPIVPRYWAISKKVKLVLINGPETIESKSIPLHKKNAGLGFKTTIYSNNIWIEKDDANLMTEEMEITLMDWGNCIIKKIIKVENTISELVGELHLEGDFKKTKYKLTWLANIPDLVPLKLIEYDFLITKKSLEKGDKMEDYINPNFMIQTDAVGDPNLKLLCKGQKIQLERKGYWICDMFINEPIVLINIPDGRSKPCF